MANYKVNWILSVSVLVGFVLMRAVDCNDPKEDLKLQLRPLEGNYLSSYQTYMQYEKEMESIDDEMARELLIMCTPSVEKCCSDEFGRVLTIKRKLRSDARLLRQYADYCLNDILKKYCIKEIDKVGKHLLKTTVSEESMKLVRPLVQYLERAGVLEKFTEANKDDSGAYPLKVKYDSYIARAFSDAMKHNNIPPEGAKSFQRRLTAALNSFATMYAFFFEQLGDRLGNTLRPKGDILIREWYNLRWIALRLDHL